MPRYKEKRRDDCRECPYCGYTYQVECEDYSEDLREEECSECGKKYWASESICVTHFASPDCTVNGQEHDWVFIPSAVAEGRLFRECRECSKFELAEEG